MSRPAIRNVEFYTDGKLVKTVTDAETARAIGKYNDIYNKINSFSITATKLEPKRPGFVREAILARSHRLKIVCVKEYLPNVPEIMNGAQYQCGILNTRSNKFEQVDGGVQVLYYKLFRGWTK